MDRYQPWEVTTHDWSTSIDEDHLRYIRANADLFTRGGLRHMMLEVLAYADDEASSTGRVGTASITMSPDGTVSVRDDGRGTDTRRTAHGQIIRKPVMATRDVRFFDNPEAPLLSDGLPRRGMSVIAALSSVLSHENRRDTGSWIQTYHHGIPEAELIEVPGDGTTGTTVSFAMNVRSDTQAGLLLSDKSAFTSLRILVDGVTA